MATGKKSDDIFKRTTQVPKVSRELAPRNPMGRPVSPEPYTKVTVTMFNRHIMILDKAALAIGEKTRKSVFRAELVRALIEQAAPSLDPDSKEFDRSIQNLLQHL